MKTVLVAMVVALASTGSFTQTYTPVDNGSKVHFVIDNFGIATGGDFKGLTGTIKFDASNPVASDFAVSVDVSTIDTDIESRDNQEGLGKLRRGATTVGVLLALSVLAMTVGLIRSESAGDLRTLTATGASSLTRRAITATTSGGLALLGVGLGILGAYAALIAGHLKHLAPLQWSDLVVIAVVTPVAAAAIGWLFAGREPAAIARRPIA